MRRRRDTTAVIIGQVSVFVGTGEANAARAAIVGMREAKSVTSIAIT